MTIDVIHLLHDGDVDECILLAYLARNFDPKKHDSGEFYIDLIRTTTDPCDAWIPAMPFILNVSQPDDTGCGRWEWVCKFNGIARDADDQRWVAEYVYEIQ